MEIGDALYKVIRNHGEPRILSDIVQGESSEIIKQLYGECLDEIKKEQEVTSETKGMIAEAMMHYLLTTAMIPSQRKTQYQSIDVDIAVPDTKTLSSSPQDVVLIAFPKSTDQNAIISKIDNMKKIQPHTGNIWVVTENHNLKDVKSYSIDDNMTISNILNDLVKFTSNKKQSKFKIFKIQ